MRHVLLAAMLAGCAPDVWVTLPSGSLEGMESVIYAVEGPDGSIEVATGASGSRSKSTSTARTPRSAC